MMKLLFVAAILVLITSAVIPTLLPYFVPIAIDESEFSDDGLVSHESDGIVHLMRFSGAEKNSIAIVLQSGWPLRSHVAGVLLTGGRDVPLSQSLGGGRAPVVDVGRASPGRWVVRLMPFSINWVAMAVNVLVSFVVFTFLLSVLRVLLLRRSVGRVLAG